MRRFLTRQSKSNAEENLSGVWAEPTRHTLPFRATLPISSTSQNHFNFGKSDFTSPKAARDSILFARTGHHCTAQLPLRNPPIGRPVSLHTSTLRGPLMMSFEQFLRNASHSPLVAACQHVAAGGRAIGFVGPDIPVELLLAADAFPLQLRADPDGNTPLADQHFEPSFPVLAKSIAEQWLSGKLDFLSSIVFSRASDSIQRCYYYLCDLHNSSHSHAPAPLIFDVAKIPRSTSLHHTHAAILSLAESLSAELSRLPEAVALRDRRRMLIARLADARRSPKAPSGVICSQLMQIADTVSACEFDQQIDAWLDKARPMPLGPRLVLAGTAPTTSWIHEAVEMAGGSVVAEIGEHAIDCLGPPIGPSANPSHALARHYHCLNSSARSFADPADTIARRATEYSVSGAVLWLSEEDEALPWQLPALTGALNRLRIPTLILSRQRHSDQRDAALRINRFVAGLGSN